MSGGRPSYWESIEGERTVVPTSSRMTIEDTFGRHDDEEEEDITTQISSASIASAPVQRNAWEQFSAGSRSAAALDSLGPGSGPGNGQTAEPRDGGSTFGNDGVDAGLTASFLDSLSDFPLSTVPGVSDAHHQTGLAPAPGGNSGPHHDEHAGSWDAVGASMEQAESRLRPVDRSDSPSDTTAQQHEQDPGPDLRAQAHAQDPTEVSPTSPSRPPVSSTPGPHPGAAGDMDCEQIPVLDQDPEPHVQSARRSRSTTGNVASPPVAAASQLQALAIDSPQGTVQGSHGPLQPQLSPAKQTAAAGALTPMSSPAAKAMLGEPAESQRSKVRRLMQGRRMICVTYHLPVILRRAGTMGQWTAQWDADSFLARSDESLADDAEMHWVGVVTRECMDRVTAREQAKLRRESVSSIDSSRVKDAVDAAVDQMQQEGSPLPAQSGSGDGDVAGLGVGIAGGDQGGRGRSVSQAMSECSDDGEGLPDTWEDESLRLSLDDRRGITQALRPLNVIPVFMDDAVRLEATRRLEGRRLQREIARSVGSGSGGGTTKQLRQLQDDLNRGPVQVGWSPTLVPGSRSRDFTADLDGGDLPYSELPESSGQAAGLDGRRLSQDMSAGRDSTHGSEGRVSRGDDDDSTGGQLPVQGTSNPAAVARAVMGVAPYADGDHGGFFDDGDYDESAGEEDDEDEESRIKDAEERPSHGIEAVGSGSQRVAASTAASEIVSVSGSGVDTIRAPRARRAADRLFKLFNSFCATVLRPALHNILDTGDDFVFADDAQASLGTPSAMSRTLRGIGSGDNGTESKVEWGGPFDPDAEEIGQSDPITNSSHLVIARRGWRAYVRVNEHVAKVVKGIARSDDVVWTHDHHLCLVPAMLRRMYSRAPALIYFMHQPFPTSEIFRTLAARERLLRGMLSADIVGFHAFNHARHFLHACKRTLGVSFSSRTGGRIGIDWNSKDIMLAISHVGVDAARLDSHMCDEDAAKFANVLRKRHKRRIVIGGFDSCQRLSGVALKLLAFERLLEDNSVYRHKVVLVQRCELQHSRGADYRRTSQELKYLVERIRAKFGPEVIDYEEAVSYSTTFRVALYYCADVLAQVPIREGINLLPLEYVYCRTKWQTQREDLDRVEAARRPSIAPASSRNSSKSRRASEPFKRSGSSPHLGNGGLAFKGGASSGAFAARSSGLRSWGHSQSRRQSEFKPSFLPGVEDAGIKEEDNEDDDEDTGTSPMVPSLSLERASPTAGETGTADLLAIAGTVQMRQVSGGASSVASTPVMQGLSVGSTHAVGAVDGREDYDSNAYGSLPAFQLDDAGPSGSHQQPAFPPALPDAFRQSSLSGHLEQPEREAIVLDAEPLAEEDRVAEMIQRSASLPDLLDAQISSEPEELTAPLPPPTRAGCLVLSEFSTASHVINGSIKVNPFNIPEVTTALDTAVLMSASERATRQWRDYQYALQNPSKNWARQVVIDAISDKEQKGAGAFQGLENFDQSQRRTTVGTDERSAELASLDVQKTARNLQQSRRRVILVDYGGTLVDREGIGTYIKHEFFGKSLESSTANSLNQQDLECLRQLSDDPHTMVVVTTGLNTSQREIDRLLQLPNLTVASEKGMLISWGARARFTPAARRATINFLESAGSELTLDDGGPVRVGEMEGKVPPLVPPAAYCEPGETQRFLDAGRQQPTQSAGSIASEGAVSGSSTGSTQVVRSRSTSQAKRPNPGPESASPGREPHTGRMWLPLWLSARDPSPSGSGGPTQTRVQGVSGIAATAADFAAATGIGRRQAMLAPENIANWNSLAARARGVMEAYMWRVNGSRLRVYPHVVAWDYRDADPEWAQSQAGFLEADLRSTLKQQRVGISKRSSRIEVYPLGLDKGIVVDAALTVWPCADFVLAVGDDQADEDVFRRLMDILSEQDDDGEEGGTEAPGRSVSTPTSQIMGRAPSTKADSEAVRASGLRSLYTVAVGRKRTSARYFVQSSREVNYVVRALAAALPQRIPETERRTLALPPAADSPVGL